MVAKKMSRQLSWRLVRKVAGRCMDCGRPAQGACRCEGCKAKRRDYQRAYMRLRRAAVR